VQLTAPSPDFKLANREVEIDSMKHPHLGHSYAATSHSSQGQTADRVMIHVDTELGAKYLLNNRMAYVAVSRSAYDAQIYQRPREAECGSAHAPEQSIASIIAWVSCQ
jgi:ATP-dependent exoDNAse (exonuclease V) alpha subunit